MKKFYVYGLLAVMTVTLSGSLQAMGTVAFTEGFSKELVDAGIEEGAVAGGADALLKPFADVTAKLDEAGQSLLEKAKGNVQDAEYLAFKEGAADLGGKLAEGVKGEIGKLNYTAPDVTAQLDKLGKYLDPETINTLKTSIGEVKSGDISALKAAEGAKAPVPSQLGAADKTLLAAKNEMSSFRVEAKKLNTLKSAKVAAGDTSLDPSIAAQEKVVNGYGYGSSGSLTKAFGKVGSVVNDAISFLKGKVTTAGKEIASAESEVAGQLEAIDKASGDMQKATRDLKSAQADLNGLKKIRDTKTAAGEDVTDINTKIQDANLKVSQAQKAIEDASGTYNKAVKSYGEKTATLDKAQTDGYDKGTSTSKQGFDKAQADLNYGKSTGADTKTINKLTEARDQAEAAALKDADVWEKAKMKGKTFVTEKISTLVTTFLAGVIFLIPGMLLQGYQDEQTRKALLETISSEQNFGGIRMQIPQDLVNSDDPLLSVFLYVGISEDSTCDGDYCVPADDQIDENTDFFVSEGASDFEGWATQPITSTSFSGKMIHLNTGYTFYADGEPADVLFPAKPLLSIDTGEEIAYDQAPPSVATFLGILHGVLSGDTTIETFNPAGDWGFSFISGPQTEQTTGEEVSETTVDTDKTVPKTIAPLIDSTDTSCNISTKAGTKAISPCPAILQDSLVNILAAGMSWPSGENDFDVSITNIWPLSILSPTDATTLLGKGVSVGGAQDEAMPAYGIYIYKTTFTALGKQLNDLPSSGGDAENGVEGLVGDYVVALDDDNNVVPLKVPILAAGEFPEFAPNPKVAKLYSLFTLNATLPDGSTQEASIDTTQDAWQLIIKSAVYRSDGQIDQIKAWYPDALKKGPFTIGGKKLTIDSSLVDAGPYIYTLDPANQAAGTTGTLEDGSIDYLVAIGTDGTWGVDLATDRASVDKFVSLVSSRFYDKNLKPYNKANGYDDGYFQVCWDTQTTDWASTASELSTMYPCTNTAMLGTKEGPYQAPLYTLYMDTELNPYNFPPYLTYVLFGLRDQLGDTIATLIEAALKAAGVTDTLLAPLSTVPTGKTTSGLDDLISIIVSKVQTAAGDDWAAFSTAVQADPEALDDTVNSVMSAVQNNASMFGDLGTQLQSSYSAASSGLVTALNAVADGLLGAAPRALTVPETPADAFKAGFIMQPIQWAKATAADEGVSTSAVDSALSNSYTAWTAYMESKENWVTYYEKGPFDVTPDTVLVPITIEATSVADLDRGVYIYTSPSAPGQYFVYGSGISDALLGKKFTLSDKESATYTPYLRNLSTGKTYDVSTGSFTVQKVDTTLTNQTDFVETTFGLSQSDPLWQAIQKSQEATQAALQKAEFAHSFYRFGTLLLDNSDVDLGYYIYQDVTKVLGAQTMDRDTLLTEVPDFLVYAELVPGSDPQRYNIGIEMPAKLNPDTSRLISLVSGIIYKSTGPTGTYELFAPPADQLGAANLLIDIINTRAKTNVGGTTAMRPQLLTAIQTRVSTEVTQAQQALAAYTELTTEDSLTSKGYTLLTADPDVSGIIASTDVAPPIYPGLKLYNGKYYQLYPPPLASDPTTITPQSITDFSVVSSDTTQPELGIIYQIAPDGTVSVNNTISGTLLEAARVAAGIKVENGTQSLTIPNEHPGFDTTKVTDLAGFTSKTDPGATYAFKRLGEIVLLYVTPTATDLLGQTMPPYYLDPFSGTAFDQNGKPISIGGFYGKDATSGRYLIVSTDPKGPVSSILYESTDGIVLEYKPKDMTGYPNACAGIVDTAAPADWTGSYNCQSYMMTARFDPTINLLFNIYTGRTATIPPVYTVTEQSAITYITDESGQTTQSIYTENKPVRFDISGKFTELEYKEGFPEGQYPDQSVAYELFDNTGALEAVMWQDTNPDDDNIDYVIYRSSNGSYVANYTMTTITPVDSEADATFGTVQLDADGNPMTNEDGSYVVAAPWYKADETQGTSTISLEEKSETSGTFTIHYTDITSGGTTYTFVEKLNILNDVAMDTVSAALQVSFVQDYMGRPMFVNNLTPNIVTLSGTCIYTNGVPSCTGNIATYTYKAPNDARDVAGLLGDQLSLVKVIATGPPAADTRYLYQVGSAGTNVYPGGDANFQFYTAIGFSTDSGGNKIGNYIDIETGAGYDATTGAAIGVANPSEVLILRDFIVHASPQLVDADGKATTQAQCTNGSCKKLLTYFA